MIFEGGFSGHANIPRVEVDELVQFEEGRVNKLCRS